MNRGMGLVAYGDSDSESSGDDTSTTMTPKSSASAQKAQEKETPSASSETKDHAAETPSSQDALSTPSIVNAKPSTTNSLNKLASTNLLKQGIVATGTTSRSGEQSPAPDSSGQFTRSLSGTPLPADHSAAAEVFNTPTGGRSPQVPQAEGVLIEREIQDMEGVEHQNNQTRAEQMRLLLRPHPIPGVENFGIPPEPEGEVNPEVQAKIQQFHHVKVTRGIHFNQSLMKNKNFRNPRIYASLVELVALNETGSNFEKSEFFDFEGYGPESYATGLGKWNVEMVAG
ncbi:HCNGP-like protein-domain-containing protein [Mortierella sp. GBAus27b]|nr:HCNGP-like protein-domain-containing protein [Mortierella sp. GBAus27b]